MAEEPAGSLSYGGQRMLELARVIAGDPKVVLLDEPSAGLNDAETELLAGHLRLLRQEGVSLLQQNAAGGLRYGASIAYLGQRPPNLRIVLGTLVTGITIRDGRARGITVTGKDGARRISASMSRPRPTLVSK